MGTLCLIIWIEAFHVPCRSGKICFFSMRQATIFTASAIIALLHDRPVSGYVCCVRPDEALASCFVMSQVVAELKRSAYKPQMAILVSCDSRPAMQAAATATSQPGHVSRLPISLCRCQAKLAIETCPNRSDGAGTCKRKELPVSHLLLRHMLDVSKCACLLKLVVSSQGPECKSATKQSQPGRSGLPAKP